MRSAKLTLLLELFLAFGVLSVAKTPAPNEAPHCDKDCPTAFACHLVCQKSCHSVCVPLKIQPPKKLSRHPQRPSSAAAGAANRQSSTEIDEPFASNANPFFNSPQRDEQNSELTTPLTISESELETELKKGSTIPEPPSTSLVAPPQTDGQGNFWTWAPGELGGTEPSSMPTFEEMTTLSNDISSPGFSPEPPGISTTAVTPSYSSRERSQERLPHSKQIGSHSGEKYRSLQLLPATSTHNPTWERSSEKNLKASNGPRPHSSEERRTTNSWSAKKTKKSKSKGEKVQKPDWQKTNNNITNVSGGCPIPKICAKNCGIMIDGDGCQTCHCMWISLPCATDLECIGRGQFCDLGRCECKPGFEHDSQSGVCRKGGTTPRPIQMGVLLSSSAGGIVSGRSNKALPRARWSKRKVIKKNRAVKRARRSPPFQTGRPKPMQEERLHWPGPCETDEDCPANLYCIQYDCWSIPDKPLRNLRMESSDIPLSDNSEERILPTLQQQDSELSSEDTTATTTEVNHLSGYPYRSTPQPKDTLIPLSEEQLHPDKSNLLQSTSSSTIGPPSINPPEAVNSSPKIVFEPLETNQEKSIFDQDWDQSSTTGHDEPKDLTETQKPNVDSNGWREMDPKSTHISKIKDENTGSQETKPTQDKTKIFYDYSQKNRMNKPIRVEAVNAKDQVRSECERHGDCGEHFLCCKKKWCDLSQNCGMARFCLPDCRLTKMIYLSPASPNGDSLLDIVYD
ncbi:hypothetical protein Ddc_05617 [Ditylenchus destructor]|nr:hypothetical protein Ddc_05617 [Ditylenchus destructor]